MCCVPILASNDCIFAGAEPNGAITVHWCGLRRTWHAESGVLMRRVKERNQHATTRPTSLGSRRVKSALHRKVDMHVTVP